jgi:peptidoglycan/LPS O-acetylase OafA/YrhL
MKGHTYFKSLDSLRAIACIVVILFHSHTTGYLEKNNLFSVFKGGFIGVDLFFVLSGFLITNILTNQFLATGTINRTRFYIKRALRLYPPILVSAILFLFPLYFYDKITALSNLVILLTYTGDCVMLVQKVLPWVQYPHMFGHSWSLAIEEQFYLFYPLLFLAVFKFISKRKNLNIISSFPLFNVLFIVLIVGATMLLHQWFYKFFLWRFFQIFFGGYIAIIYNEAYSAAFPDSNFSAAVKKTVKNLFANRYVFALSLFTFSYMIFFYFPVDLYNFHYYLITVVSAVMILNATRGNFPRYNKFLSNKVLVYIGKISYGLYLYHYPVFFIKRNFSIDTSGSLLQTILLDIVSMMIILAISVVSYEFVEKPILSYKSRLEPVKVAL